MNNANQRINCTIRIPFNWTPFRTRLHITNSEKGLQRGYIDVRISLIHEVEESGGVTLCY